MFDEALALFDCDDDGAIDKLKHLWSDLVVSETETERNGNGKVTSGVSTETKDMALALEIKEQPITTIKHPTNGSTSTHAVRSPTLSLHTDSGVEVTIQQNQQQASGNKDRDNHKDKGSAKTSKRSAINGNNTEQDAPARKLFKPPSPPPPTQAQLRQNTHNVGNSVQTANNTPQTQAQQLLATAALSFDSSSPEMHRKKRSKREGPAVSALDIASSSGGDDDGDDDDDAISVDDDAMTDWTREPLTLQAKPSLVDLSESDDEGPSSPARGYGIAATASRTTSLSPSDDHGEQSRGRGRGRGRGSRGRARDKGQSRPRGRPRKHSQQQQREQPSASTGRFSFTHTVQPEYDDTEISSNVLEFISDEEDPPLGRDNSRKEHRKRHPGGRRSRNQSHTPHTKGREGGDEIDDEEDDDDEGNEDNEDDQYNSGKDDDDDDDDYGGWLL